MKIAEHVWMIAAKSGGKPILFHGLIRFSRGRLIKDACAKFYRGTTWTYMRRQGWRAVKVRITGRLP